MKASNRRSWISAASSASTARSASRVVALGEPGEERRLARSAGVEGGEGNAGFPRHVAQGDLAPRPVGGELEGGVGGAVERIGGRLRRKHFGRGVEGRAHL